MPVPGYDPEDLDDTLENLLSRQQKQAYLTDEQWETYREADANLVDLLDPAEIESLLEHTEEPSDATGD